jgi:hypothetical protein
LSYSKTGHEDQGVWLDHIYRTVIGRPMPFVPSGAGLDQDVASPSWSFP